MIPFVGQEDRLLLEQKVMDDVPDKSNNVSRIALSSSSVHLLSLQYLDDNDKCNHRLFSKRLKEIWKWKDAVLGNGNNFIAPKPKQLKAVQSALIAQKNKNKKRNQSRKSMESNFFSLSIDECSILSNCARLEIMMVVSTTIAHDDLDDSSRRQELDLILKTVVSNALLDQSRFYQSIPFPTILQEQLKSLDRRSTAIPVIDNSHQSHAKGSSTNAMELRHCWTHRQGTEEVCRHLCLVAAGMATRPNRPLQPVEFRPFSSRDAHILVQLKRTLEITDGKICQKILQSALAAGKACRNVEKVPEIAILKPGIWRPNVEEVRRVNQAVLEKAIDPTVQECLTNFVAANQSQQIQSFRDAVLSWSSDEEEAQWLRKQLHEPTMQLRTQRQDALQLLSSDMASHQLLQKFQSWRQTRELESKCLTK